MNTKELFLESLGYELVEKKNEPDHEYEMVRNQLRTAAKAIERLMKKVKGEGNLEAWVQSKITKAADYIDSVADYMDSSDKEVKEAIELSLLAKSLLEEYGAGFEGTCSATDKYKEDTPGQSPKTLNKKRKKK